MLRLAAILMLIAVCQFTSSGAQAQNDLRQAVISQGGGRAAVGVYVLEDTFGQPAIGRATSADYAADDGFWPEPFNISASPFITWTNPAAIVYGTPLSLNQLNATAPIAGTFAYFPSAGTRLHAGSNQVLTAVFMPFDSFNFQISTSQVAVTVLKAPLTIAVTNQNRLYGEEEIVITWSGFVNGDTSADLDVLPVVDTPATTNSAVGDYAVTLSGGGDSDYDITLANGTLTITRAPLLLVVSDAARDYGEPNPSFTGTLLLTRNGDTFPAEYSSAATDASVAGQYPVTATVLDHNNRLTNYSLTVIHGTLTIGKRSLIATADSLSRPYGVANPPLTIRYTGFASGDTSAILATPPVADTVATTNSARGSYPITLSGGSDPRYDFTLADGVLTVGKAMLLAAADNQSRHAGTNNPPLTIRYTGFVNGDTAAVLDTPPTAGTTADIESVPGLYPITLSGGSDDFYDFTFTNGILAVTVAGEFEIRMLTSPTFYAWRMPPVKIEPSARLIDGGRPHFGGGQLTVTLLSNAVPGDSLAAYHPARDDNHIAVTNGVVSYGGINVGTIRPRAQEDEPLIVDWNTNAVPDAVETLIREISFVTTNRSKLPRPIEFVLTDGQAATSVPVVKTIHIKGAPVPRDSAPPAPYPPGTFSGLVWQTNNISAEQSGRFFVTVKASRAFSGYFSVAGRRVSISGRFNDEGHASVLVQKNIWQVELELVDGTDVLRGSVTHYRRASWTSELRGHRSGYSPASPTLLSGSYTLSLPGSADPEIALVGNGWAAITINPAGRVLLRGTLADGQPWAQTSWLSTNNLWPVHEPLDRRRGILIGWQRTDDAPSNALSGTLTWIKPRANYFPHGVAAELETTGSRYQPPGETVPALPWTDGLFSVIGGNLINGLTNDVVFSSAGLVSATPAEISGVQFKLDGKNGIFRGQFYHPLARRPKKFSGVLLQAQETGAGFFLGVGEGGFVLLKPVE